MITKICKTIVPDKLLVNSHFRNIKITDKSYITDEFEVYTNDNTKKIENVKIVKGRHPNCDPLTKNLCLPETMKENELNDKTLLEIITMIRIFNFQSAYDRPWNVFDIIQE